MDSDYVSEWFRFAASDLFSAEYLLGRYPQPLELICYLCEQSTEKYLKGYLIYRGVEEPPRIHKLDALCEMCSEYDERFREIEKACNVLTQYGVQPRYPNEIEISEQDMKKALEYARQVQDFELLTDVLKELEQKSDDQ